MEHEQIILKLIMHGGDARAKSLLALSKARTGDFDEADSLLAHADEEINKAHEAQTGLIQAEVRGEQTGPVTLLLVHGQDHLMNAMTVRDLAKEMVEYMKSQGGK